MIGEVRGLVIDYLIDKSTYLSSLLSSEIFRPTSRIAGESCLRIGQGNTIDLLSVSPKNKFTVTVIDLTDAVRSGPGIFHDRPTLDF